ncbi:MAG: hypothetical protein A2089_11325 [Elusimicrobia bacterium GWD2_63_28]|nr:MAG: hypothetical protein A2089_11325 [Elusimicrobia bacterium GWD2_63_28]
MKTEILNSETWERLYVAGRSVLKYPDSNFVTLASRLTTPDKHKRVLDYGFGTGANMIHLISRGHVLSGAEVSSGALEIVRKLLSERGMAADLRLVSGGKLPFADAYFDAVVAWQVLYYNDWISLPQAMAEIERVLKPGGLFIGTMAAEGDISGTEAEPLGRGVYRSHVPGQEGAIVMVLTEKQVAECFIGKQISIGRFGMSYGGKTGSHWVITYEK